MSETRIEWCGNIQVHHPVKEPATIGGWITLEEARRITEPAEPRSPFMIDFDAEVERKIQRYNEDIAPRIEFWHGFEQRKAA